MAENARKIIKTLLLLGLLAAETGAVLPNGWLIHPPAGPIVQTGTMPQGAAASPDGKMLAVVESGFNPPALHLFATADLRSLAVIPLAGAFGRPLWRDARHVLVAGANAGELFDIDAVTHSILKFAMPPKSYPVAVAFAKNGSLLAVATDNDGAVRIGSLATIARQKAIAVGLHPSGLAFTPDGATLFASNRAASDVVAVDTRTFRTQQIHVGLHPSDLLVANRRLYVALSDADTVGIYDAARRTRIADVFVGDDVQGARLPGSSPNALARSGDTIFVSLGASNSIAVLRGQRVIGRVDAGWYPTDVVPIGNRLFVIDGKGEGTRPNPRFNPLGTDNRDYVAAIQYGSIRVYRTGAASAGGGNAQGAIARRTLGRAVVRAGGPIRHVFFILKENRSYDQVLGDMPQGNGDPKLVWFGKNVTPNQHALAGRFGLFDNAYTSGEVSDPGHNWADGAFANDYVERFWPPTYGGRRDNDDVLVGFGAGRAQNGYMWDAAERAHVSFRDYGELAPNPPGEPVAPLAPTLHGRFDPRYMSWDLDYSDVDRFTEWRREFDRFVRTSSLPQLEYIWLPNDHTYGSRAGKLTPASFVAQNDYAVGLMIDAISHSPVWRSSAVFITEDDAQDGADHVSGQRTTLYIASPYARGGVQHGHYSTVSVLRTIEIILGIAPLSVYDATAVPLYDAFTTQANMQPFHAVPPRVSITARNARTAYGASRSAALDFSRPDAGPPGALLDILAHNVLPAGLDSRQ